MKNFKYFIFLPVFSFIMLFKIDTRILKLSTPFYKRFKLHVCFRTLILNTHFPCTVPMLSPGAAPNSTCCYYILEAVGDGSGGWSSAPAWKTFWFWPAPTLNIEGIWGVKQRIETLCIFCFWKKLIKQKILTCKFSFFYWKFCWI